MGLCDAVTSKVSIMLSKGNNHRSLNKSPELFGEIVFP